MIAEPLYFKIFPNFKTDINFGFGFDIIVYGRIAGKRSPHLPEIQALAVARVRPWEVSDAMPPDASDPNTHTMMFWNSPLKFEACLPALYESEDTGLKADEAAPWLADACNKFMSSHWHAYSTAINHLKDYCKRNYLFEEGKIPEEKLIKLRDTYY